jgi:hypothetical protein
LSDGASRRATTGRTTQRRKGVARGGRHGLTRPAVPTRVAGPTDHGVVAEPTSVRRFAATAAPQVVELTREQEFAYIRSDMRRLFVIAAGLLVGMLVLLIVVSR